MSPTNIKLRLNSNVTVRKSIQEFHYRSTPHVSLLPVLHKLQRTGARGIVRRYDSMNDAIAVQFPNHRDFLWFKTYEVDTI